MANPNRRFRELSKADDSADRHNRFRQLYTPSNKLGHSLKVKEDRTISVEKNTYESGGKAGKETIPHSNVGNDQISRKYR